jgi:hypothetical protein
MDVLPDHVIWLVEQAVLRSENGGQTASFCREISVICENLMQYLEHAVADTLSFMTETA